jgi:hypothetical protein
MSPSVREYFMRRTLLAAVFPIALVPMAAAAQLPCPNGEPPKNSNVAKMLAWFAGPLAFSQGAPVARLPLGAIELGGDLTWVPTPPASITHTDACYSSKTEHPGISPLLPRPRLTVGLGSGFSVEAMYLPPVTVADATPNMGSLAVAWASPAVRALGGARFTARAHSTFGQVRGPITCPRSVIQQTHPEDTCYANTPSKDTYQPNINGAEAGVMSSGAPVKFYVGAGYSWLMPRFQVGYLSINGAFDSTRVHVDLARVTGFAGVGYAVTRTLELTAQLYSVPVDATSGRVGFTWRLR